MHVIIVQATLSILRISENILIDDVIIFIIDSYAKIRTKNREIIVYAYIARSIRHTLSSLFFRQEKQLKPR